MRLVIAHLRFPIGTVAALLLCAGCATAPDSTETDEVAPAEVRAESGASSSPAIADEPTAAEPAQAQATVPEPGDAELEPRPTREDLGYLEDPCDEQDTEGWLDKSHEWVYETVCGTAAWFDGFFGNRRYDEQVGNTYGRIGLSGFWDQRDGFDPKLRFRGTFALPALRDRGELMIGRGDEDEIIEERTTNYDTIPGNFNRIGDDSFLIGLGYSGRKDRGFKVSVGAKLRAPPEPYIKLRYRKHWTLSQSTLLGVRPILYWKSDDKLGSTLHVDLDQMLNDHMMLRWANYGNVAQGRDVQGLEWQSSLYLFQALSNRKALTYSVLILGETKAEVPLVNYGFEFRYRQRILRDWLFLELISSATWPRELMLEDRDLNLGIGIGLEMYFGPVPDAQMY